MDHVAFADQLRRKRHREQQQGQPRGGRKGAQAERAADRRQAGEEDDRKARIAGAAAIQRQAPPAVGDAEHQADEECLAQLAPDGVRRRQLAANPQPVDHARDEQHRQQVSGVEPGALTDIRDVDPEQVHQQDRVKPRDLPPERAKPLLDESLLPRRRLGQAENPVQGFRHPRQHRAGLSTRTG